jgi:ethanolamine ammonia-lyase small subunit
VSGDPLDRPGAAPLPDLGSELRRLTPARVGLGRAGPGWPTREVLRFGLGHARARDAVHHPLDVAPLTDALRAAGYRPLLLRSAAPDRATYLTRPDLGRRLDGASAAALAATAAGSPAIALAVVDGLSAIAVERHAPPLLQALCALDGPLWSGAPLALVVQGRVAVGDEIGERLGARLCALLIGERPGLSSPDSLGVYLTFAPRAGRGDAERNCLSNVRPAGLGYDAAARRLHWLATAALRRGLTGVGLKDESDLSLPSAPTAPPLPPEP